MLEVEFLIKTFGYIGLFAIVFAETGLFFGFFLPGDSLLFTAGILASRDILSIVPLCAIVFSAAVIGDSTGYAIGRHFGKKLFKKEDSIFFHKNHLARAKQFYDKHGGKTIILARFMPIIRTFAPVVAGMGEMHYPKFLFYNVIGAALWAIGLPVLGFYLGNAIPNIDLYLLPIIAFIILLSISPGIYQAVKTKERRLHLYSFVRSLFAKH